MSDDFLADVDVAAIDRYITRIAREEEADIEREHGEFILEAASGNLKGSSNDALLEVLREAWASEAKAKPSEAEDNQQ